MKTFNQFLEDSSARQNQQAITQQRLETQKAEAQEEQDRRRKEREELEARTAAQQKQQRIRSLETQIAQIRNQ
jgi:hypothetical protein